MIELPKRRYSLSITPAEDGKEVVVCGWIHESRDLGGIAFIILRDREGTLQVVLPKKKLPKEILDTLLAVNRESVIAIRGTVKASPQARNGYEILPVEVEVLSRADAPLPLPVADKVFAEIDTRLDNRYMDLRKPEIAAIFHVRSALLRSAHAFFAENGFTEVHTPKIISAASEGGTDLFPIAYFEKKAFLAQSPQLYKQMLMATGLDRVYEIAWYFRAEQHNTRRHLNESTAIDVEMAYVKSEEDVMGLLERLIQRIWSDVTSKEQVSLAAVGANPVVPKLPFARVSYDDALKRLNAAGHKLEWGEDMGTEAEKKLGDLMLAEGHEFYFITRYPAAAKPFYAYVEDDAMLSRSFDLDHKGLEVTSGAQRQHDHEKLVKRLEEKGLNPKDFTAYLSAFRYGMPPHGGFGLGIERLVMELLGVENVRETILFPRDRVRLTP